jgi:hypothetical protein
VPLPGPSVRMNFTGRVGQASSAKAVGAARNAALSIAAATAATRPNATTAVVEPRRRVRCIISSRYVAAALLKVSLLE